jgi:hypothetical protein
MSCADVCVSMDWDGYNDFYTEAWHRAVKPHTCIECARVIAPRESYHKASGKNDGDFFTEKTCAECAEIRKAFCCGGFVFGYLWESIREQLFPSWDDMKAIDCLAQLTSDTAIAKMRAEYDQFLQDQDC